MGKCIVLNNGKQSLLYDTLVSRLGSEQADSVYRTMTSEEFMKGFGDYQALIDSNVESIPNEMKGRVNPLLEPEIFEDEVGHFYLDKNFVKQYLNIKKSPIYEILSTPDEVNVLVGILGREFVNDGGLTLDINNIDLQRGSDASNMKEFIKNKTQELGLKIFDNPELNDDLALRAGLLLTITDNEEAVEDLVNKIQKDLKSKKLSFTEEENNLTDGVIGEEEVRDVHFNKSSVEMNPKTKVRAAVKLRLSLITDPTQTDPYFGLPKPIEYTAMYNKMVEMLVDTPMTYDENGNPEDMFKKMVLKLEEFQDEIEYLPIFLDFLKQVDAAEIDLDTPQGLAIFNFKSGFVTTFNLQRNAYMVRTLTTEEVVVQEKELAQGIDPSTGEYGFYTVKPEIKDTAIRYTSINISDTSAETSDLHEQWTSALNNFLKLSKDSNNSAEAVAMINRISTALNTLMVDTTVDSLVKAKKIETSIAPAIGLKFSEKAFNYYLNGMNTLQAPVETRLERAEIFNRQFVLAIKNAFINFQKGQPSFAYSSFNELAKAHTIYMLNESESSIRSGGKSKYLYSSPSYAHNKVNVWKNKPETLKQFRENSGIWTKISPLMSHLLADDIQDDSKESESAKRLLNFRLVHANTYSDKTNSEARSKNDVLGPNEISKSQYVKMVVNGLLNSRNGEKNAMTEFRTTTPAGKSSQFDMIHDYFANSGVISRNGTITQAESSVKMIEKLYLAELSRMREAYEYLSDPNNPPKMYYHVDAKGNVKNGNAFKSQLFPELGANNFHDTILPVTIGGVSYPLFEDGRINIQNYNYYQTMIGDYIFRAVKENIAKTVQELEHYAIIEKQDTKYKNKGIDSRVWKSYAGEHSTISQDALNIMAGDIFLNGLINHVEYSKLFAGDVAYYKNPVDYIKRIGATYTDGTYMYTVNDTGTFKAGIIESVEVVDKYKNDMLELFQGDQGLMDAWSGESNIADAQAYITVKRWRDIMLGLGKFNGLAITSYDKMIGKNKEPLTKDELKLVAQPLKGVYFELREDGTPTFLKYSQAVLMPGLVKQNGKLQDMVDYMEHHGLDELVTFDGIKAGSFIPTNLHNEAGELTTRDENGNFKDIQKIELKSTGWKLQQDLPTKTFKDLDIGSQVIKNMLMLIAPHIQNNSKVFEFNGEGKTADELIKDLDSTYGSLIADAFDEFLKEFKINPETLQITDPRKFQEAVAQQLEDTGVSEYTVKALRAGLSPLALTGVKSKSDSVFANIVKDRLVKVKTNGGAFIQMSNFAMSKQEADDKFQNAENRVIWSPQLGMVYNNESKTWEFEPNHTVAPYTFVKDELGDVMISENGNKIIKPEQILLSGSFIAKYIPDYQKYSAEELFGKFDPVTGKMSKGLIDNRILENIIGYRIPNQGASSNGALQVVGILPPSSGDTVVAFSGITKKTGSDKISLFDPV